MPRIVTQSEKERIMKEAIAEAVKQFHRNSCYPDPMDFEVEACVAGIVRAIDDSLF